MTILFSCAGSLMVHRNGLVYACIVPVVAFTPFRVQPDGPVRFRRASGRGAMFIGLDEDPNA